MAPLDFPIAPKKTVVTKLVGNFRLVGDAIARARCALLNEDLPRDSTYVSVANVISYGMGAETNSMIALIGRKT